LLKPSHGKRILAQGDRSGFSPQAEYIFRKQLEEADYLMIGRSDQLDSAQIQSLRESLQQVAADVPILEVSPNTGDGVDEVLRYIESPMQAGRRLLEIDYDTYAAGEADLGWVNLSAMLTAPKPVELDSFIEGLVRSIADVILQDQENQIAHLKASILTGDTQAVANVVSNDSTVDMGLRSGRTGLGLIQLIVNARVAMDPDQLEAICRDQVLVASSASGMSIESIQARSLRPGRPEPTHRVVRNA